MKHGFVKVAAVTPNVRVADVWYNCEEICRQMAKAEEEGAKVIVFPELCMTGYTCGDLFTQSILLREVRKALLKVMEQTRQKDTLVFVGMPLEAEGKLYNVAAALNNGRILGFTTKTYLPNYAEFYEMRQFCPGPENARKICFENQEVFFGPCLLFQAEEMPELIVSAEICEDVWAPIPPSIRAAREGAVLFANCSASDEMVGKAQHRRALISGQSSRTIAGYIYANAGEGESTTDVVFSGHNIIAENGSILKESPRFQNGMICSEIDIHRLHSERRKNTTFQMAKERTLPCILFQTRITPTVLTRKFSPSPFLPSEEAKRMERCEEILMIQAMGLKKRMLHTGAKKAVVGISGGLDSALALLVTAKAFDLMGKERSDIIAVTMPCFGTTNRTYKNACKMTRELGAMLKEVPIGASVLQHFLDIGHAENERDVTYENAQARERTQVLMDIANQEWGLVIGTGDLSELALGWATYNGDHMSMYGVNSSIPKTSVQHLISYCAQSCDEPQLSEVLRDILATPVSPELLPPEEGKIAQRTEDLVGPYELHDFFLYYMLRFCYEPSKIYRIAKQAFEGVYDERTILKWLRTFYRRFFSQQFKRSCLPDGPKVGTVALSPRGDWKMPSDACVTVWLQDLERIEDE